MRAPIPLPRTARPAPMVPLALSQAVASVPYPSGAGAGAGVAKLSGSVTPKGSSGKVSENVSRIDMGRIKRNVGRMAKLGAPPQEIDAYIASEGVTVEGVRSYREPDSKLNMPTDSLTGLGTNLGAGINRALLEMTGGAVDRSRNVMNWGIAGANLLTGQKDLTTNMLRNAVGDSDSIAGGLEAVGMRDPRSIQPQTMGEQIAAGVGEGIGYTVAPEMAFGVANRLGAVPKQMQEMLTPLIGSGASPGAMATNAFAGGAAGAGAVVGGEMAPEPFKPLASMVGGLAGGLSGALAANVPGAVLAGGRAAADYVAPFSQSGRERLAGETLRDAATNPGAVLRSLEAGAPELVPGSRPTTFQATGDMGLGGLERGAATADPATFNQLRADQNAARVAAVEGLQGAGSPEAVVTGLRNRLSQIDQQSEAAVSAALGRARGAVDDLGPGLTPEAAGESVRSRLEAARAAAKSQERALWGAVDPDGTLALGTANTKSAAKRLADETPAAAKQPDGEEAAILSVVRGWRDVVPFSEVTALQSRLKAAMREERFTKGESPTWRRMSILNDRMQADLEAVVASKGANAAPTANSAPPAAFVPRGGASVPSAAPGAGTAIFTPSGRRLDVSYQVVEADQLVPSNLDDLRPNPRYLSELQPRNRTRTASDVQIARMAGELQPERLGASASASEGAPIVGPDGMVESGNARTLAIRRAYQDNGASANAYRQFLASQGYDVGNMRQPVLVRVRQSELSPADRVRFTQEANAGPGLALSASERAATDASRLDGSILSLLRGNDVTTADNRDFVRAFLGKVAEQGEEGAFVTKDGQLSVEGAQRVRGALMRAAYDDNALVEALLDAGDDNIRVFGRAMTDLSGDVARVKAGIREGKIDPAADVSPAMVEAAKVVQAARKRGVSLPNALAQRDAFDALSDEALQILEAAYGAGVAGRVSRERFDAVLKAVISEAEQQTTDARLFGEPLGLSQILSGAVARYGRTEGASGPVPYGVGNAGPGNGTVRQEIGRPGNGPVGPGGTNSGASGGILEAPRPELAPNFDPAALGRLNVARSATRQRVETFDNKTLGPLRRRPSTTAPYDVPTSAVMPRLFASGPRSVDAIATYRAAVGDDAALDAMAGYAIDRLRLAALRDDGTLDPRKVETWLRSHSDAMRAFPELRSRINNAAQSSEALAAEVVKRKAALDAEQSGALGRLIGAADPGEVVAIVGTTLGRGDAASQMMNLRLRLGKDKAALEGLRKAVVDHMVGRFVSNTEAGTSGVGAMKSDAFQTFIKQKSAALRAAGFNDDEIARMVDVADDLQRANRSLSSVRIPGQSNTAQDLLAAKARFTAGSFLRKLVVGSALGGGAWMVTGPWVGAAVGISSAVVSALRASGVQQVDELVKDALLNPNLARLLLSKVGPKTERQISMTFAQLYRRAALAGVAAGAGDENEGRRNAR